MNEGRVKIYRCIQDNRLWSEKPFSHGQAWIDMILLACHKPSSFNLRGRNISLKAGQLAYSLVYLADRWGWDRKKIRRFFLVLENAQQITQQKTNVTTIITITNYAKYQGNGTADGTPKRTADGTAAGHKQECKELKEQKPEPYKSVEDRLFEILMKERNDYEAREHANIG
jgi:hypothetical protein